MELWWPAAGKKSADDTHPSALVEPAASVIDDEGDGRLSVTACGFLWPDAFAVRAFPLTEKDRYISLLQREPSGRECEFGMIRSLAAWPQSARAAVERSLGRRYLLQSVDEIRQIRSEGNQIRLLVSINGLRREVQVDNRGDASCRFGGNGLAASRCPGELLRDRGSRSASPRPAEAVGTVLRRVIATLRIARKISNRRLYRMDKVPYRIARACATPCNFRRAADTQPAEVSLKRVSSIAQRLWRNRTGD